MSMSEGTKNTLIGVVGAATLTGIGVILSNNTDYGRHLAKIDTVLEQNHELLKHLEDKTSIIPPVVESEIRELRDRLNLHEDRINQIERKKP